MKSLGVAVLFGAAFLLSSCEKEGVLEGSGEMVTVNISLGDVVYDGNETVTRGYSPEIETVSVALGEGLFMYATIEKNREAEMRAGEPLADGVKVRVVAYQGGTVKGTGEYTVKSGVLVSENGSGFAVEEGMYDFVAYSYNSAISPDHSGAVVTVASPNDLLWGDNKNKTISVLDNEVTITMRHMFAQVTVKATMAGADITDMHGVTVSPGNSADLTVETGGVVKNAGAAAAKLPVSWGDEWVADEEVTSDPVVIYTGTNTLYVDMESISIEGYDVPFTNARATFNKVLTEGYSYTLVISFKQTRWAKSNIYWKWRDDSNHDLGGYLTFDTNENGHQGYQGVYFKWGSLVGISPAQAGGSDDYIGQDIPLYVPVVEYPLENSSWEMTSSVAKGWTDWGLNTARDEDIPYMDPDNYEGGNYGRTNEYAMDAVRNEYAVYKNYRGDICQYLSTKTGVVAGDWRLPTSEELGPQATGTVGTYWSAEVPIVEGWMRGIDPWPATNTAAGYADGTADLLDPAGNNGGIVYASAIYQPEGNVVFPASGQRERDDGRLGEIGGRGQYWTGSLHSKPSGYGLDYRNASVIRIDSSNRSYAYPVRCVQN